MFSRSYTNINVMDTSLLRFGQLIQGWGPASILLIHRHIEISKITDTLKSSIIDKHHPTCQTEQL